MYNYFIYFIKFKKNHKFPYKKNKKINFFEYFMKIH